MATKQHQWRPATFIQIIENLRAKSRRKRAMNQISRGGQAIADEVEEVNKDCDLLFGNHIAAGSYETILKRIRALGLELSTIQPPTAFKEDFTLEEKIRYYTTYYIGHSPSFPNVEGFAFWSAVFPSIKETGYEYDRLNDCFKMVSMFYRNRLNEDLMQSMFSLLFLPSLI